MMINVVRKLDRLSRIITSPFRDVPKFIIIGAQKSATSSLYDFISQHPSINSAQMKEIHYYDLFFKKGFAWYKSHFPFKQKGYITGEATPNIIWSYASLKMLKKTLPDLKLIISLRDPYERTISHYYHNIRQGRESRDLLEAISSPESQISSKNLDLLSSDYIKSLRFSYISKSRYAEQLDYLLEIFNTEDMLFAPYSKVININTNLRSEIFNFLGLEDFKIENMSHKNEGIQKDYFYDNEVFEFLNTCLLDDKNDFLQKMNWSSF